MDRSWEMTFFWRVVTSFSRVRTSASRADFCSEENQHFFSLCEIPFGEWRGSLRMSVIFRQTLAIVDGLIQSADIGI
jgi:hypothetical protein